MTPPAGRTPIESGITKAEVQADDSRAATFVRPRIVTSLLDSEASLVKVVVHINDTSHEEREMVVAWSKHLLVLRRSLARAAQFNSRHLLYERRSEVFLRYISMFT